MATTPTIVPQSTQGTGGLTPIQGATTEFNTTGYPAPPPPGSGHIVAGDAVARQRVGNPTGNYPLLPSRPSIAFSIADLQQLGNVREIGRLAFVVTFVDPVQGQLLQFAIQITSPEGKELAHTNFRLGDGAEKPRSEYVFTFNEEAAECVEKHFVPGNRITVVASSATAVRKGVIQVAVIKCV